MMKHADLSVLLKNIELGMGLGGMHCEEIVRFYGMSPLYFLVKELDSPTTTQGKDQRYLLIAFMLTIPASMSPV